MKNEVERVRLDDWILKVRKPTGVPNPQVVLLLHGWTGDEDSMWVFGSKLPESYLLIAPKAPHPSIHAEYGGYSWSSEKRGEWPSMEDFKPSIEALRGLIKELSSLYQGDFEHLNLVGFSQGAALCYSFALHHAEQVKRVAALSGFFPEGGDALLNGNRLAGMPVFIGHGTHDDIVPVAMAYAAREAMEAAGANVSFCETEVGHKLGADCFKAFQAFMGE